jgi:phage host-nuclease inhibitor protein Gam
MLTSHTIGPIGNWPGDDLEDPHSTQPQAHPSMSTKLTPAQRAKKAKLAHTLTNDDQLTSAVSRHVSLDLIITSIELERDAEIKAITERYAAKLEPHIEERGDLFEQIEDYTRRHRARLMKGDSKTVQVAGHDLSYRLGNPTVITVKGITQKAVLAELLEMPDETFADRFIRWKESLNKEAVLGAWNNLEDQVRLRALGLDTEQVERLHLSPSLQTATPTTGQATPVA